MTTNAMICRCGRRFGTLIALSALACLLSTSFAGVPPGALGSRAAVQTGQQPQPAQQSPATQAQAPVGTTVSPRSASSPPPSASGMTQPGATPAARFVTQHGAAAAATKPAPIVLSSRTPAYSPNRNDLLRAQATVLAEQNEAAQAARRIKAASAAQPSRAATMQRAGALAASPFMQGPSLATKVATRDDGSSFRPGIHTVNGKEQGVRLTPGGYLTLSGVGFGETVGQAALFMTANAYKVTLTVVDWHDTEVYVLFQDAMQIGTPDQPVRVQLLLPSGKTYVFDGAQFYAPRKEVLLQTNLTHIFRVDPGESWPDPYVYDNGVVLRFRAGLEETFDCQKPGMDRIVFLPLLNGFKVTGVVFWHGPTDSGDGTDGGGQGSRTFFPGYSLGDWTDEGVGSRRTSVLHVNWGVWRQHQSPMHATDSGNDLCQADYQLAVSVIGPVGVPMY